MFTSANYVAMRISLGLQAPLAEYALGLSGLVTIPSSASNITQILVYEVTTVIEPCLPSSLVKAVMAFDHAVIESCRLQGLYSFTQRVS